MQIIYFTITIHVFKLSGRLEVLLRAPFSVRFSLLTAIITQSHLFSTTLRRCIAPKSMKLVRTPAVTNKVGGLTRCPFTETPSKLGLGLKVSPPGNQL